MYYKSKIMNVIKFRSPCNINEFVYKKNEIILFIKIINNGIKDKIVYKESDSISNLHKLLNEKMALFKVKDKEWFWCNIMYQFAKTSALKQRIKRIDANTLRPETPKEWLKNPIEWLNNYDITKVMSQYSNCKKYKYKFIGVFPIDFAIEKNNTCLYSSVCSINVKEYVSKKIKYIGFITNLDKHNESGSHWTSTFIILDPENASYGAHYYDSTVKKTPAYIEIFINRIKKQCLELYPKKEFKITYNKKKHQRKNTECGVFSMIFQIRWINFLLNDKNFSKNPDAPKILVADNNIKDDVMVLKRSNLFRPNILTLK